MNKKESNTNSTKKKGDKLASIIVIATVAAILIVIVLLVIRSNKQAQQPYSETRVVKSETISAEEAGATADDNSEYMRLTVEEELTDEPKFKEETILVTNAPNSAPTITQEEREEGNTSGNSSNEETGNSTSSGQTSSGVNYSGSSTGSSSNNSSRNSTSSGQTSSGVNYSGSSPGSSGTSSATVVSGSYQQNAKTPTPTVQSSVQTKTTTSVTHEQTEDGQYVLIIKYDKGNKPSQDEIDRLVQEYIDQHRNELISGENKEENKTVTPEAENNNDNTNQQQSGEPDSKTVSPGYDKNGFPLSGVMSVGGTVGMTNNGTVIALSTGTSVNNVVSLIWNVEAINGEVSLTDTDSPFMKNIYIADGAAARISVTATYVDGVTTTSPTTLIKHKKFQSMELEPQNQTNNMSESVNNVPTGE
jgi:uncharacterized protein YpmB